MARPGYLSGRPAFALSGAPTSWEGVPQVEAQAPAKPVTAARTTVTPQADSEAKPPVLSEWGATVLSIAADGKSAVVVCAGDTDSITVPVEVPGLAVANTVKVVFGEDGKVALVNIVQ